MLSSKKALFSLRRAAFLGMILLLLAIFFTQFAVAADGNINISGTKYLDANSNGKFDSSSEQTLKGYTIYIHKDNTGQLQQGDPVSITNEKGMYSFTNISDKGFVRELVSSGDQFQPSSPKNGYNLADAKNGDILDFGNSIPNAANSALNQLLLYLIGGFGALIILCGGIILIIALWRLNSLTKEDIKGDRKFIIQIVSGFILLVLGLCLLISLAQMSRNMAISGISSPFALVTPVVLTLLVFGAVLLMLYTQTKLNKEDSEAGGMRKTIAGLLVVGLIVVVLFALSGRIESNNENLITQYVQLVGIVVAFYFGSKATSEAYKGASDADKGDAEKDLEVKTVSYDPQKDEILIEVLNGKGRTFGVETVKIKDLTEGAATGFGSESFKETPIPIRLKLKPEDKGKLAKNKGKEYDFTIVTTSIGSKTFKSKIDMPADQSLGEASGNAKEDLKLTKITYKDGNLVIDGSNDKRRSFVVKGVSIAETGQNPAFDKTIDSAIEVLGDNPFKVTVQITSDADDNILNTLVKGKKPYDITLKTSINNRTDGSQIAEQ